MARMSLSTKHKQTHRIKNKLVVPDKVGEREVWSGSLRLVDANYDI